MWLNIEKKRVPRLNRPALVVAVSTSMPQYRALYSQAREMADYMLRNMSFERIATLRSSAFPPEVLVREDGVSSLPSCSFYLARGKGDLLLFAGDTSPMDDQYEFGHALLGFSKDLGVGEVYSVGARWAENPIPPESDPVTTGFATDRLGVTRLKKHGVKILSEEPAPFFSSMVVGMAAQYGMRGYKISVDHGEPSPHVRSVAKLLGVLSTMLEFEVSLDELKSKTGGLPPPRQAGDSSIYH
jgi:proteasome assembly chaperone (PAC2) family protein